MSKTIFILLSAIHFIICVGSGIFGWQVQFLTIGLSHIALGIPLLRLNPFERKWLGPLILFMPLTALYLITVIVMLFYSVYTLIPFLFVSALCAGIALAVYKKPGKAVLLSSVITAIGVGIMSYYLLNYYYLIKPKVSFTEHPSANFNDFNLMLRDSVGNSIKLKGSKGEIIIIDVWASSCAACIKGFPQYDSLTRQYSSKGVEFYTLNVNRKEDDFERVASFTAPYSFKKLYTGSEGLKKLGIKAVPCTIILDENLKVVYMGQIYTDETSLVNNFHKIIAKLTL